MAYMDNFDKKLGGHFILLL